jgi:glycosyltransferase involved in cell wall biosynthesis
MWNLGIDCPYPKKGRIIFLGSFKRKLGRAELNVVVDAIIYQSQSRGGISRLYSEILPRMAAMDDALQFILLTTGPCRQSLPSHARIQHRPLLPVDSALRPYRLWWPVIPSIRAFVQRAAVGDAQGRIWHSTYYTMPAAWSGPVVVIVADMIYERFTHLFDRPTDEQVRQSKRRCILAADMVICISETTQRDVLQFYDIEVAKTVVVPLAHRPMFRLLEDRECHCAPPTNKPFLLYVGGRRKYKNFEVLLKAYSIWPRREEFDLVIVGGGPWSKEETQHLTRSGLTDQVHLLADVDDRRLCLLYNQARAFVYPSLYEGFGVSLLEAMACGCPIIASHIPSTIEVAGECPIYFEPADAHSLLAAFDVALSEKRDSERVQLGRARATHYCWDKTARQVLDVYHALSDPGRTSAARKSVWP